MNKTPADYKADPSEIQSIKEYYINALPKVEIEPTEPVSFTTDEVNNDDSHSPGLITVIPEETE